MRGSQKVPTGDTSGSGFSSGRCSVLWQALGHRTRRTLASCRSWDAGRRRSTSLGTSSLTRQRLPRHFERSRDVGRDLKALGIKFIYRNEITTYTQLREGEVDCLIVNTTGELKHFYQHATVIFVGKSLAAQGGQNPIEPGELGKAMVFGPNMQNFSDVVRIFLARDGAAQVKNADELTLVLEDLLSNPSRREQLGRNAVAVVRENQGAIERTVDMIVGHLADRNLYVAPRR